jgi:hypothetical protein
LEGWGDHPKDGRFPQPPTNPHNSYNCATGAHFRKAMSLFSLALMSHTYVSASEIAFVERGTWYRPGTLLEPTHDAEWGSTSVILPSK